MAVCIGASTGPSRTAVPRLVKEDKGPAPTFTLPPGAYIVSVGVRARERDQGGAGARRDRRRTCSRFPAGGLRIEGRVGDARIPQGQISFDLYKGSQFEPGDKRPIATAIMTGDVVLVPEGTYHIVSNYGDANSTVRSDIRVQVGKLTDTTVNHRAAIITLKLVNERGGEARANTQWSVLTPGGDVIKESIGAFPRVILAEGEYRVDRPQRQQDLRGRVPGGQRRRPRGRGHRALKRRRRQARSKRAISIAPAYDACVAVREVKICE